MLAGIGFTTDHAFHRFLKRTIVLDGLFGSADDVVVDIGRALLTTRPCRRSSSSDADSASPGQEHRPAGEPTARGDDRDLGFGDLPAAVAPQLHDASCRNPKPWVRPAESCRRGC